MINKSYFIFALPAGRYTGRKESIMMTREEKLYAMRGAELIKVAEDLGIKVAHKGTALKESKEKAIAKILAAEAGEVEESTEKSAEEIDVEEVAEAGETEKAEEPVEKKVIDKFFRTMADLPSFGANVIYCRLRGDVVGVKVGKIRLFAVSKERGKDTFRIVTNKYQHLSEDIDYKLTGDKRDAVIAGVSSDLVNEIFRQLVA